ncbi:MAG: hypothetical protein JXO22_07180 [Phycisphaerae bacterium]|nr:hypothetical protein [Phycisphaerae bacterium]
MGSQSTSGLKRRGRRLLCLAGLGVLLAAGLMTGSGCATTGRIEPTLTPEQRELNVASFDYMWTTIRDKHWDPTLGGLDWDAVRDELRPKVEQADKMSEARAAMRGLIARLGKSHFNLIPSEVYDDMQAEDDETADSDGDTEEVAKVADKPESGPRKPGVTGMEVRAVDGVGLVTVVDEGPAANAGVHPGWQIVAVDGRELAPILAAVAEQYSDSLYREFFQSRVIEGRLRGNAGDHITVTFVDGDNQKADVDLELEEPAGKLAGFGNMPRMHVRFESRLLDGNIGYVRLNIFLDPARIMIAFQDAVKAYMGCDGIIIDLRGNPGGLGAMAMGMAGWFVDEPNLYLGTQSTRTMNLKFAISPRAETYAGPLAILVDGGSASTSEIMAGGMQDIGRARIFGTRTPGAALPSVFERLPNGDGFQYAFANYTSASGQVLEGHGVVPDVEVRPDRAVLLAGHDPVIDAAAEWIHTAGRASAE